MNTNLSYVRNALTIYGDDQLLATFSRTFQLSGPVEAVEELRRASTRPDFPPVLTSIFDAAMTECVLGTTRRTIPDVQSIAPFARLPALKLETRFPINEFLTGNVSDPFVISPRKSMYLACLTDNGMMQLIDIADPTLLECILSGKPVCDLLAKVVSINAALEELLTLTKRGIVVWLRP